MGIRSWPDYLRAAGIKVAEHNKWRSNAPLGELPNKPYIVWHHDASPVGPSPGALDWIINSYNSKSASAQIWVGYDGTWHFVGSGIAWHTGAVLSGMPGNYSAVGIETDETTGENWSPALLSSLRKGTAAIMAAEGMSPSTFLHFHKTICAPKGRKSDPSGLDLSSERSTVGALAGRQPDKPAPPTSTPAPDEELDLDMDAQTFKQLVHDGTKWALEDPATIDALVVDESVNRAVGGQLGAINAQIAALVSAVNALAARVGSGTGPVVVISKTVTVAPGDTLSKIAERHGVTVADIVGWNGIKNPSLIEVGQVLLLEAPKGK